MPPDTVWPLEDDTHLNSPGLNANFSRPVALPSFITFLSVQRKMDLHKITGGDVWEESKTLKSSRELLKTESLYPVSDVVFEVGGGKTPRLFPPIVSRA